MWSIQSIDHILCRCGVGVVYSYSIQVNQARQQTGKRMCGARTMNQTCLLGEGPSLCLNNMLTLKIYGEIYLPK